jgi:hypothetical protein
MQIVKKMKMGITTLLEESVGREDVFNDLLNIGQIVVEKSESVLREAAERHAMGSRGFEPREFKYKELKKLVVFIMINY